METQTSNFATQTIDADDVINFPSGLIGFEEQTQFGLFHEESNEPTVHWLQSVTDDNFSISVISPTALGLEYEIQLTDDDEALLKLDDINDVQIVLAVYKQDEQADANDSDLKAVIRAPIIINTKENIGLQKHLEQVSLKEAA